LSLFGTVLAQFLILLKDKKNPSVLQNHTKICLLTILAATERDVNQFERLLAFSPMWFKKFSIRTEKKNSSKGAAIAQLQKINSLTQSLQSFFGSE